MLHLTKHIKITIIRGKGSSETTRAACFFFTDHHNREKTNFPTRPSQFSPRKNAKKQLDNVTPFSYWLAGLIDGDGYLGVSQKGYTSCEITLGEREYVLLYTVKQHLGGTISKRSHVKAWRWRLHNAKGMHLLVKLLTNKLLTQNKVEQLLRVSKALGESIEKKNAKTRVDREVTQPLKKNYWCAGFFEAEGYLNVRSTTLQCSLTISNKDKNVLLLIKESFGGAVYYDKSWQGYLYWASSITSLEGWFTYFRCHPLKSQKNVDLVRFIRIALFKKRKYHLLKSGKKRDRFYRLLDNFWSREDQVVLRNVISENKKRQEDIVHLHGESFCDSP